MEYAWWFMTIEGVMTEEDYPNQSHETNKEYDCRFDPDKVIGKTKGWATLTGKDDVTQADINTVKHHIMN